MFQDLERHGKLNILVNLRIFGSFGPKALDCGVQKELIGRRYKKSPRVDPETKSIK